MEDLSIKNDCSQDLFYSLSDEQIENIKAFAADLHPPKDIAYMIGVAKEDFGTFVLACNIKDSAIGEMYYVARLTSLAEIRKALVNSAKSNNPDAIKELAKIIEAQNFDNAG